MARVTMTDLGDADRLTALQRLRDRIYEQLDETASARDVASLARQLQEVLASIDELTPKEEEKDGLKSLVPGS